MVRVARGLCRRPGLRRGRRRRLRRGRLRRRCDDALLRWRWAGRPETARRAVAARPVRRTIGLRWRRSAGHGPCLRAHERPHVLGGVREERHVARALERRGEHPLMLGAGAALAARVDLAAIADVATDAAHLFEVDLLDLVHAERADLAARPPRSAETRPVAAAIIATAIARAARSEEHTSE